MPFEIPWMHGHRLSIDINLIITPENSIAGVKDVSFQPVQARSYVHCAEVLPHTSFCIFIRACGLPCPFGFRASINSIVHTFSGIGRIAYPSTAVFLECWKTARLLAHGPQRVLPGKHHRGSASSEPGIVVRSICTNDTTNGHEKTVQ